MLSVRSQWWGRWQYLVDLDLQGWIDVQAVGKRGRWNTHQAGEMEMEGGETKKVQLGMISC